MSNTDRQHYISQGHPKARVAGGEIDDIHNIVTDFYTAMRPENGDCWLELENGGEFDYEADGWVYNLYDDDGGEHPFAIEGELVGDVLEITIIRKL